MTEKKDKAQSKRFIEKARELGADNTGSEFERALKKIVLPQRAKSSKSLRRSKGS